MLTITHHASIQGKLKTKEALGSMASNTSIIECVPSNLSDHNRTAVAQLQELGIVYLKNAIDIPFVLRLKAHEREIFEKVENALLDKGINYKNQTKPWAFSDVASRSPGRFDVKALPKAFQAESILKNQYWIGVVEAMLGKNYKVAFSGIVESLPGSVNQQWHRDGNHLYDDVLIKDPYALTCFIPLAGINEANGLGSPQFLPESHHILAENNIDLGSNKIVQFKDFPIGDALLFDYRLVHRGVENVSTSRRPLMYIVYAKSFWTDHVNFGGRPLLNSSMEAFVDKKRQKTFDNDDEEAQRGKKPKVSRDNSIDSTYFNGYLDHNVHKKMLSDGARMKAYERAVNENANLFKDKVVMDIGAGSGILSLLAARAGAKRVFSVEASDMASLCEKTIEENGFNHVCSVIHSKIEDVLNNEQLKVVLGDYLSKVDVIISEWMGLLLVQESVLDSVLYARDKFLNPDTGVLFPSHARIYICPTDTSQEFKVWDDVCGFKFDSLKGNARKQLVDSSPLRRSLHANCLCAKPKLFKYFALKNLSALRLHHMQNELTFLVDKGKFNSVSIWFDVRFAYSEDSKLSGSGDGVVVLGTGPKDPHTHWEQAVVVLPEDINMKGSQSSASNVTGSNKVKIKCILAKSAENFRHYVVDLDIKFA